MRKTWYSGSGVYGAMLEPEYQVFLMDRGKPLLNSISLASHDFRKRWYSVLGVYGAMLEVVRASKFSLPGI